MQNKKIKSLNYKELINSTMSKSVVLTLVKLCIIFYAGQKTTAQFLIPQPTLNKVILLKVSFTLGLTYYTTTI